MTTELFGQLVLPLLIPQDPPAFRISVNVDLVVLNAVAMVLQPNLESHDLVL